MHFLLLFISIVYGNLTGSIVNNRCSTCTGLTECKTLEGKQVPDRIIGYTREQSEQLNKQGICMDYDSKAKTVPLFGSEFQFKDTKQCRDLVNEYNCLSWASHKNSCPKAPLPPCRSLCVEIADKCVFMHLYRYFLDNVCARIKCEYLVEQRCVPGELEQDISNDRCTLHKYSAPRGLLSRAIRPASSVLVVLLITSFLYQWV